MDHVLKVFGGAGERKAVAGKYRVLERYPAFLLILVPEREVAGLAKRFWLEDITTQYVIRVGRKTIRTGTKVSASEQLEPGTRRHHYLVAFIGPIKKSWLQAVRRAGGQLRTPYQNFAYVVRATPAALARIRALRAVRAAVHLPYWSRIATAIRDKKKWTNASSRLPQTKLLPGTYTVEFFGEDDARGARRAVRRLGLRILADQSDARILILGASAGEKARRRQIEALARVHGVRSIRERALPQTANDVAGAILRGRLARGSSRHPLTGKGEIVAVCDTGLDTGKLDRMHPDFQGRIVGIRSYPIAAEFDFDVNNPGGDDGPADLASGHGTHVAGSALGDGSASKKIEGEEVDLAGMAPRARLFFQAVEQRTEWRTEYARRTGELYELTGIPTDVMALFVDAYRQGARIHNNSWGGGNIGAYDSQCDRLDRFVWEHKDFCVLVAAGNDAIDADGNGRIEEASVTPPATAKNCITVGACESLRPEFRDETYGSWWRNNFPRSPFADDPMANNPEQVVAFSSRGPTGDGRVKPEVVAPGTYILSTRSRMVSEDEPPWAPYGPSPFYFYMGGTSMATPLVTGGVALVREHLRTREGIRRPSAALVKASLVVGARRIGSKADRKRLVDSNQGFGRVDLDNVLAPRRPYRALFVDVRRGLETGGRREWTFRVASSTRPLRVALAYSDYPGKSLVNDLNLLIRDPHGRVHAGNEAGAARTLDHKNNVEVAHFARPATGEWRLQVVGSNVPHGPQDFAFVCLGAISGGVKRARVSDI